MQIFAFGNQDAEKSYRKLMEAILANDGAECAQVPDIFYPEDWQVSRNVDVALAKQICGRCPMKLECLEYALPNEDHGIFGGLTAHERRQLRQLSRLGSNPS
jgi:WhiB family redox-sensing transcriptional regulator